MNYMLRAERDSWNSNVTEQNNVVVDHNNITLMIGEAELVFDKVKLTHVIKGSVPCKLSDVNVWPGDNTVRFEFNTENFEGEPTTREIVFKTADLLHIMDSPLEEY